VLTLLKERKLDKKAECCLIEVENKVHEFHVKDIQYHLPQEIYDELNQLVLRIKEMVYLPYSYFVLHDVEDELNDQ
jgi:hypothetical protein